MPTLQTLKQRKALQYGKVRKIEIQNFPIKDIYDQKNKTAHTTSFCHPCDYRHGGWKSVKFIVFVVNKKFYE